MQCLTALILSDFFKANNNIFFMPDAVAKTLGSNELLSVLKTLNFNSIHILFHGSTNHLKTDRGVESNNYSLCHDEIIRYQVFHKIGIEL